MKIGDRVRNSEWDWQFAGETGTVVRDETDPLFATVTRPLVAVAWDILAEVPDYGGTTAYVDTLTVIAPS